MDQLSDKQKWHREVYLKSSHWKQKSKRIRERDKYICQDCRKAGNDVHHKTYDRYPYHELDSDLITLCRPCHKLADAKMMWWKREIREDYYEWSGSNEPDQRQPSTTLVIDDPTVIWTADDEKIIDEFFRDFEQQHKGK